jgi:hypothetical protein
MSIDLNSNEFDNGSSSVSIFNGGNAGVCSNCTITTLAKDPNETRKLPNWKLIATDESGASTDLSFYYVDDPSNMYYEANLKKQGKILKHLVKTIAGPDVKIPIFNSNEEMLDKCGTVGSRQVSGYIKIRSFVPMLSSNSNSDTLQETPYDTMQRPQADAASSNGTVEATGSTLKEDDWI